MNPVALDKPGKTVLMMGNEAIARGAIEAGVDFSSSYPGSPSSEIQETLARTSSVFGHYAQWAVNEKIALEACIGASFAGLRSITSMKQNGLNVASDTLMTANLSGVKGGVVLVVCDDPSGHSSTNEQDSRSYARFADLPLLEPSNAQEAKEMTQWAFKLSEELSSIVVLRSVTRISHARGNVELGEISPRNRKPHFGPTEKYLSLPPAPKHANLHNKLKRAQEIYRDSDFNAYLGPENAQKIIVTSGTGYLYAREAINYLGAEDEVGLLKVGTSYPLLAEFIEQSIKGAEEVLVVEEVDPFLEDNLKCLIVDRSIPVKKVYGKSSGHVAGKGGPGVGELNTDIVTHAIESAWGFKAPERKRLDLPDEAKSLVGLKIPSRELAFCPGCPHRTSFWVTYAALKLNGADGAVMGDIGCYSMGAGRTGHFLPRTMHCMGSGIGFANGLGQIEGFDQPVVAFAGDSTFYHACIPALISARYNKANLILIVLDNGATSMTGFQPHPGTGQNALGEPTPIIEIENISRGMGIDTYVADPFDIDKSVELLYDLLQEGGLKVVIFRHTCALVEAKHEIKERPDIYIDKELCVATECGCNRFCSRVFGCPALIFDEKEEKAAVDEVLCNRCGACITICPKGAIKQAKIR